MAHYVHRKDIIDTKKCLVLHRKKGSLKRECAILCGISTSTLHKYCADDEKFRKRFRAAWLEYQEELISLQKIKDPWKLLTTDFKKRFTEKLPTQQNLIVNVTESQLAQDIVELFGNSSRRTEKQDNARDRADIVDAELVTEIRAITETSTA